jgi:NDP-sugar pyrophosphorylase family protein
MQAVILAGGLGTRLWPLTKTVPKPMVPVAGVPYLEHQLRLLEKQGIRSILILTGYLGEQIEDYFGDGQQLGLAMDYSREQTPVGTGGALREAREKLAETFLVIYGDSYLPIGYTETLAKLEGSDAAGLLVVYDNRLSDTSVKNNVDVDAAGYVTRYEKDSPDPLGYVEAGVLAFRREIVPMIAPEGAVSLEKEIFPRLIAARRLIAQVTTQRFYDIGTPERLTAIEELLAG